MLPLKYYFFNYYLLEFTNPLNHWEKQELIIKLRKEGKSYREIAHITGVSLRDIKPTLRKYERNLQNKKGENNNPKIKKLSKKRCRAYDLFPNRKNPVAVPIDLELDYDLSYGYPNHLRSKMAANLVT